MLANPKEYTAVAADVCNQMQGMCTIWMQHGANLLAIASKVNAQRPRACSRFASSFCDTKQLVVDPSGGPDFLVAS